MFEICNLKGVGGHNFCAYCLRPVTVLCDFSEAFGAISRNEAENTSRFTSFYSSSPPDLLGFFHASSMRMTAFYSL